MKFYSSDSTRSSPHSTHLYTVDTDAFTVDVDPIDQPSYRAMAEVAAFGPLTIAKVETTASVVTRNPDPPNGKGKRYSIIVAVNGNIKLSHHLGMSELTTGEFILMDNMRPRTMFIYEQVSLLIISVPEQVLRRFIPLPDEVEAQKMVTLEMPKPFYEPLIVLWEGIKKNQLAEFAPALSEKLLGNVSELYSAFATCAGGRVSKRVAQVKQAIEEQLGDPELTVESLAASLGVSSRYLRDLFSQTEKLSHYILRRRLEECANQLANALHQSISITAIAFQYGFNSTAHFSRTFRKHYGLTPREYRNKHLHKSARVGNDE
jgi:AraC family transcriptional regulator, positive regulator of tynA and feaB